MAPEVGLGPVRVPAPGLRLKLDLNLGPMLRLGLSPGLSPGLDLGLDLDLGLRLCPKPRP